MSNRERFEIALNAVMFGNYCLTQSPETLRNQTSAYIGRVLDGSQPGGLPLGAIGACRSLGIEPSTEAIIAYINRK